MHNQSPGCTLADVFFSPFLGFVYTAIAGLLSDKMQSNEGSKHFTGRIKESQSFSHNKVKTYKKLLFCFCYPCVFIYIDYFSMSVLICYCFFFFFHFYCSSFQSHWSSGFMENAVFICLSPSVVLFASDIKFTDVYLCFYLPLHVMNLCPYPPSSRFTKVCSFLPWCDSISILHCEPCSHDFSHCQLCISFTSQSLQAHTEPVLYRGCAGTTVLYGNKAMQHLGQALPLLDVCLSFFPRKNLHYLFFKMFTYTSSMLSNEFCLSSENNAILKLLYFSRTIMYRDIIMINLG